MMKIKRKNRENIVSCQLRRTHPIGPIIFCKDLYCFEFCVDVSRIEKEMGLDEIKGHYSVKGIHDDIVHEGSRHCFCGQPIAKGQTPHWSFKGMFVCHLKAKHPSVYEGLKNGDVKYDDLFFWK